MALMDRGRNQIIDNSASKVDTECFEKLFKTHSPHKYLNSRLQLPLPLRSLENTEITELTNAKTVNMVCLENVDDSVRLHKHQESPGVVTQESNSCSQEVSSQTCSFQKSVLAVHNGSTVTSTPTNSLINNMVRTQNCNLRNVEIIYKDSQNLSTTDIKDNTTKFRIRTEAFADFYTVEEQIGRGKFAVVKRCRHKTSGLKYAAKFLRKRRKGKDCRAEILQEVSMLEMAVVHPRLVNLLEVYETSHEMILITEYAEGGELFQRVCMDENFDEQETRRTMRQILEGVLFLHERNIVHLDIKPQNILLTNTSLKSNIKLCDLGFARHINSGEDIRDIIGTPDYVAPEILSYEPIHLCSDMWSIGVLTYVLLTGLSPFAGDTKQETFLNISQVSLDFPDEHFGHISHQAIDFISKLLVRSPEERLTARESLNHPWLQMTPSGSPIGQRRCLTPPSPDTLAQESSKKCRCDISPPSLPDEEICTNNCTENCTESHEKTPMVLSFEETTKEDVIRKQEPEPSVPENIETPITNDNCSNTNDDPSVPPSVNHESAGVI